MSEEQTPQPEPERDEPVEAPRPVETQDDDAPEQSDPATLDDQDNGQTDDVDLTDESAAEGAPDGEERRADGDVGGTVDQ